MNIFKKRKIHNAKAGSDTEKKASPARKLASAAIVVALAAVTVVLSGTGSSTDDAKLDKAVFEDTRPAIEYVVELPEDPTAWAPDEEKKERRRSKLWSLISLPLSFIGGALGLLLRPLLGKILFFAIIAAVLFGIFCLCLKLLFPDKSLKELLTGRNFLTFLCAAAVFIAAFNVPEIVRIDEETNHLMLLAAAAVSVLLAVLLCKPEEKKEPN